MGWCWFKWPFLAAQIFEDCELKRAIDQDVIGFPPADHLPDDDKDTPYFFYWWWCLPTLDIYNETIWEARPGHPTKYLQLQNQPLQESVWKRLWHPGQSIWLFTHYHKISARYSLYHCVCCLYKPYYARNPCKLYYIKCSSSRQT